MDSPNRMANSITGRKASIGPVRLTPNTDPSQPHWNTAVRMPNAAAIDSRFITAAFSGTTRLRSTRASNRNDRSTTTPMNNGSLDEMASAKSAKIAVIPPT